MPEFSRIPADAGETKYVREEVSMGLMVGRIVLTLDPADKAQAELPSLRVAGAGTSTAKQ
ncbi:hypothetical protein BOSP111201_23065 [Bordetella sputigena]